MPHSLSSRLSLWSLPSHFTGTCSHLTLPALTLFPTAFSSLIYWHYCLTSLLGRNSFQGQDQAFKPFAHSCISQAYQAGSQENTCWVNESGKRCLSGPLGTPQTMRSPVHRWLPSWWPGRASHCRGPGFHVSSGCWTASAPFSLPHPGSCSSEPEQTHRKVGGGGGGHLLLLRIPEALASDFFLIKHTCTRFHCPGGHLNTTRLEAI